MKKNIVSKSLRKSVVLTHQPFVSVVTPVYNTEKYLAECIESVLSQTYENWEYVIVNNCSTDQSFEIARYYAKKDRRIQIYNNDEFLDVMQNNNKALRKISRESKYCKIVHADDWLFPECLTRMVEVAETYPTVGIVSAYRLDEDRVNLDGLPYPSSFVAGREVCRLHFIDKKKCQFGSPTSHLFRSDIVRSRHDFFNESHIHGDTEACMEILKDHDFGFVHQVLTYTRRHNETESSFAERMNSHVLADFTLLMKYGPIYLSEEEYKMAYRKNKKRYYMSLGRNVLKFREKGFWLYHKTGLEKIGHRLSAINLYKAAFNACIIKLGYKLNEVIKK